MQQKPSLQFVTAPIVSLIKYISNVSRFVSRVKKSPFYAWISLYCYVLIVAVDQLHGIPEYGTYENLILKCELINYIISTILLSGFTGSALHTS